MKSSAYFASLLANYCSVSHRVKLLNVIKLSVETNEVEFLLFSQRSILMGTLMISIMFAVCVNETVKYLGWRLQEHQSNPTIDT